MSDPIRHECGIAIVRLKKPLAYYREKHGSPLWGLKKLYLLMEKQRNRGQDGAGIAVLKQGVPLGTQYFNRLREAGTACLDRLWRQVHDDLAVVTRDSKIGSADEVALKRHYPWLGEIYLGHLRYGTHGSNALDNCHPYVRTSNWPTRQLSIAGNFNLTNTPDIFNMLVGLGQHPIGEADTATVMEKIGHFLEVANEAILRKIGDSTSDGAELAKRIADELDIGLVLSKAARAWDGGYFMCGLIGHGAAFALRDPNGIRPGFWYQDDEVVACASERAALVTCFNIKPEDVQEVTPGCALIIDHHGRTEMARVLPELERRSCTFERIYFSRGNDADIYRERKALGRELVPATLKAIDNDLEHTVISYIPNTAESAYYGLLEGLEAYLAEWKEREILHHQEGGTLSRETLRQILAVRPWQEKAALKDAKLRTFISGEDDRGDLVSHAYDVTRGILRPGIDNLVVIDDSIVRGTTLRASILRMLARLEPRRIVVLSSAPQIRYPDCYGIDMSELGKFVAFEAAVTLLRDSGRGAILDEVYQACLAEEAKANPAPVNHVKRIYAPFSDEELSAQITELVRPRDIAWSGDVTIVFQTVVGLRWAITGHTGDWYFTGDYPTPGGFRVANRAFINYMEKRRGRAYEARA
ncbi:MAG: class II glutamine amidotransferase [Planctomycetes bacterium]|nr:class II glutamine amidotransferase [Planctomycetota bacterium]